MRKLRLIPLLLFAAVIFPLTAVADRVPVGHKEGLVHGFLLLRALDGKVLADGDLIQTAEGDRVTTRLVFRFKDGSLHDETTVFSEHGDFRLLTDHLIQKGPAFEHPVEVTIDVSKGKVTVLHEEGHKAKVDSEHLKLPADLANGITLVLMKNIYPEALETNVSMLVATPEPRMVKLKISPHGEESFRIGDTERKATHFVVKVELGGLTGVLAEVFGKEPPDTNVWILEGEAPTFVRSEGPLCAGCPVWRIELVSPAWPEPPAH